MTQQMKATDKVSIAGLNKADVLAALYNAAETHRLDLEFDQTPMTRTEAQGMLDCKQVYFNYFNGRMLKLDLSGSEIDPLGYDRNNGSGKVAEVIKRLRENQGMRNRELPENSILRK